MNAMLTATIPLPAILDQPSPIGPGRRHCIDNFHLTAASVDRFNALLARLGRRNAPLDCDRLATAARELRDRVNGTGEPACILQRMKRLEAAAKMLNDSQWEPIDDAGAVAALMVHYVTGRYQLLPNSLPTVGHLDDAIAVDAAWPALRDEVAAFLDYCRLRSLEAMLRGREIGAFQFSRNDWEDARRAEYTLEKQRRCIRENSYLPQREACFYVH
ncbi:hypothetical protein [Lysobacter solisilvae (ex Woo and Kim 2020)]|uniref:DUF1232 domain-containing protein n=1 Tax=Agrilutibacter terrestris TaxID=2865112 RepID=A0A7H0FW30_9GAMM|nr:hypothetical protein [Lysobacter terrestris]QNP40246.1 hypothetical protein H8B22_12230 [Lysobacter terrestris]